MEQSFSVSGEIWQAYILYSKQPSKQEKEKVSSYFESDWGPRTFLLWGVSSIPYLHRPYQDSLSAFLWIVSLLAVQPPYFSP